MDNKQKAVKDIVIVIIGVAAIWLGVRAVLGTDNPFYVVSSGSMVPVLNVYDVLIVKDGNTFDDVKIGDIIVFNRPRIHDKVIVHRVIEISHGSERILTTKGDANPTTIPGTDYPITDDDYIGKVIYVIPKVGYFTRILQPPINYIVIGIILVFFFINRMSRSKREGSVNEAKSDTLPFTASEEGASSINDAKSDTDNTDATFGTDPNTGIDINKDSKNYNESNDSKDKPKDS